MVFMIQGQDSEGRSPIAAPCFRCSDIVHVEYGHASSVQAGETICVSLHIRVNGCVRNLAREASCSVVVRWFEHVLLVRSGGLVGMHQAHRNASRRFGWLSSSVEVASFLP